MTDENWTTFFRICAKVLGEGADDPFYSENWCSWTTFERLQVDAGYWTAGLPGIDYIKDSYIADGGVWGQPFGYSEIAHIVLPSRFYWEAYVDEQFKTGTKAQAIEELSDALNRASINHRITPFVLEIKLY